MRITLILSGMLALAAGLPACSGKGESENAQAATAPNDAATAQDLRKQLDAIKADIDKSKAAPAPSAAAAAAPAAPAGPPNPALSHTDRVDIDYLVRLSTFMATYPVSQAEQDALRAQLLATSKPGDYSAAGMQTNLSALDRLRDPVVLGQFREQLWQQLADQVAPGQTTSPNATVAYVLRHNPVVAKTNGKVLTRAAVQDVLASRELVAKAAGVGYENPASAEAQVDVACQELARTFAGLPAAEQDAWVQGESRWQTLRGLLAAGPADAGKSGLLKLARQSARTAADVPAATLGALAYVEDYRRQAEAADPNGMKKFRREMQDMLHTSQEITRMGTLANENTRLQSRPSATK